MGEWNRPKLYEQLSIIKSTPKSGRILFAGVLNSHSTSKRDPFLLAFTYFRPKNLLILIVLMGFIHWYAKPCFIWFAKITVRKDTKANPVNKWVRNHRKKSLITIFWRIEIADAECHLTFPSSYSFQRSWDTEWEWIMKPWSTGCLSEIYFLILWLTLLLFFFWRGREEGWERGRG